MNSYITYDPKLIMTRKIKELITASRKNYRNILKITITELMRFAVVKINSSPVRAFIVHDFRRLDLDFIGHRSYIGYQHNAKALVKTQSFVC